MERHKCEGIRLQDRSKTVCATSGRSARRFQAVPDGNLREGRVPIVPIRSRSSSCNKQRVLYPFATDTLGRHPGEGERCPLGCTRQGHRRGTDGSVRSHDRSVSRARCACRVDPAATAGGHQRHRPAGDPNVRLPVRWTERMRRSMRRSCSRRLPAHRRHSLPWTASRKRLS